MNTMHAYMYHNVEAKHVIFKWQDIDDMMLKRNRQCDSVHYYPDFPTDEITRAEFKRRSKLLDYLREPVVTSWGSLKKECCCPQEKGHCIHSDTPPKLKKTPRSSSKKMPHSPRGVSGSPRASRSRTGLVERGGRTARSPRTAKITSAPCSGRGTARGERSTPRSAWSPPSGHSGGVSPRQPRPATGRGTSGCRCELMDTICAVCVAQQNAALLG